MSVEMYLEGYIPNFLVLIFFDSVPPLGRVLPIPHILEGFTQALLHPAAWWAGFSKAKRDEPAQSPSFSSFWILEFPFPRLHKLLIGPFRWG